MGRRSPDHDRGGARRRLDARPARPGLGARARVRVDGREAEAAAGPDGYLRLEHAWQRGDLVEVELPMEPRLTEAHPWVESTHGRVAIERGPLVYCLEQADHPGASVPDLEIDATAPLAARRDAARLEGVTAIRASGFQVDRTGWAGQLYRRYEPDGGRARRPVELPRCPTTPGPTGSRGPCGCGYPRAPR